MGVTPPNLADDIDRRLTEMQARIPAWSTSAVPTEALPKTVGAHHYTSENAFDRILSDRALVARRPWMWSGGEEYGYYVAMVLSAIRGASDFTDVEKNRAEGWARHFLLDRGRPDMFAVAMSIKPDTLAGWRTFAPERGVCVSFDLRGLKALIDEKTSFYGRVYYGYPIQAEKILDKVRRTLPLVAEDSPERGGAAYTVLERKFYFPLMKLFGFLKHPALQDEHEFRLVFLSPLDRPGDQSAVEMQISLEPYFRATRPHAFAAVHLGPSREAPGARLVRVGRWLAEQGLTASVVRASEVPFQDIGRTSRAT